MPAAERLDLLEKRLIFLEELVGVGESEPKEANFLQELGERSVQRVDPWAHRSEGMRCKTCMWFLPKDPNAVRPAGLDVEPVHVGRCRRHAPTMSGFPVMFVNDWCGDHRIDENKL